MYFTEHYKKLTITLPGPILLRCNNVTDPQTAEKTALWQSLPRHRDEDQVKLDVNRSFIYYPSSK